MAKTSARNTIRGAGMCSGMWLLSGVAIACGSTRSTRSASLVPAEAQKVEEPRVSKTKAVEAQPGKVVSRRGPPKIRSARLIGPRTIELAFSESIGPTENVDPANFRLSYAVAYRYTRYAYTYYYDAGEELADRAAHVVELRRIDDQRLQILLDVEFYEGLCEDLREDRRDIKSDPGVRGDAGLFLHYTQGDAARVEDLQGNPLAPFGAPFAADPSLSEREFEGKAARKVLASLQRVKCDWN